MGLFGFGKKKRRDDAEQDSTTKDVVDDADVVDDDARDQDAAADSVLGEDHGPWDVEDQPKGEKYLDLGAFRLPARDGVSLKLQVSPDRTRVTGVTVTFKDSSLELAGFAAPKSSGLWDSISSELMKGNSSAKLGDGVFGSEISMSVTVAGGRKVPTRIVGVDGNRWMLRGIFTGKAALKGEQKDALDEFFASIVVDRGNEPLAPRDPLPLHPPVQVSDDDDEADSESPEVPGKPKGPLTPLQNTEVQQTLSRGPMFSEIR
jgi:hypothetical protein